MAKDKSRWKSNSRSATDNARLRAAIQNAASIASFLITTEAMIAEVPKKGDAAAPGGMPGGGMGGMDF